MGAAKSSVDLTPQEEAALNLQCDENFNSHQENIDHMRNNMLSQSLNDLESGSKIESKDKLNPFLK